MDRVLVVSSATPVLIRSEQSLWPATDDQRSRVDWGLVQYEGSEALCLKESAARPGSVGQRALSQWDRAVYHSLFAASSTASSRRDLSRQGPYVREMAGHHHFFLHEGRLPGIEETYRFPLGSFSPLGESDSERAFCALLSRNQIIWKDGRPERIVRLSIVTDFASRIAPLGAAPFIYSDGDYLYVHSDRRLIDGAVRPGFYVLETNTRHALKDVTLQSSDAAPLVLISDRPLSDGEWRPMSDGEVLMIRQGEVVDHCKPLEILEEEFMED